MLVTLRTHTQQHSASPQLISTEKGRTIAKPEAHSLSFTMPCHQKQPPAASIPEQRVLQNNLPGRGELKLGLDEYFAFYLTGSLGTINLALECATSCALPLLDPLLCHTHQQPRICEHSF